MRMLVSRAVPVGEGEIVGKLIAAAPATAFATSPTAPTAGDQVIRLGVNYIVIGEPQLDPIDGMYRFVLDEVR